MFCVVSNDAVVKKIDVLCNVNDAQFFASSTIFGLFLSLLYTVTGSKESKDRKVHHRKHDLSSDFH